MSDAADLFSFGTLMDADLLELVCQQGARAITRDPAVLLDHAAHWVVDDHYPVLVPRVGASTEGLVLRGLSAESLNRIVFFEGGEFSVQYIDVMNSKGALERVRYFADTARKQISDELWNLETWQQHTKSDTLPRVVRYMQCYGKMGVDEADAYW